MTQKMTIRAISTVACVVLAGCNIGAEVKPEANQAKRICTHILKPDVQFIIDPNHKDTKGFQSFAGPSSITFRDEITGEMMTLTDQSQSDWRCKDHS